jgi:hypothetical protein
MFCIQRNREEAFRAPLEATPLAASKLDLGAAATLKNVENIFV